MITAETVLHELESRVYRAVLPRHGERTARAAARALFDCLFLNFRKQCLYVPTSDKAALHERYEAIWGDFNGRNHAELAVKYRLSLQQIYTITNHMRHLHLRDRQQQLFPLPAAPTAKPLLLTVLDDYLPADLQRAGLPEAEANALAADIAGHLCQTYPGITIRITESLRHKRHDDNADLFADSA